MRIEDTGGRVVVHLDSRKASDVGNDVRALTDAHKGRTLEIDMAGVPVINADAVSALIVLHNQADKDGGKLLLSHVDGFVRAVFRVTNTDSLFEIVEGEGEPSAVTH
jgi:anti-anti-sigma regulatory factor